MRPKAALLARVKVGKRYLFEAVKIKNGKPVEPDEPTSYYLKYSQNGKQRVEAVGSDLSRAFVAFQNRELNQARTRMGLSAITELGPARHVWAHEDRPRRCRLPARPLRHHEDGREIKGHRTRV